MEERSAKSLAAIYKINDLISKPAFIVEGFELPGNSSVYSASIYRTDRNLIICLKDSELSVKNKTHKYLTNAYEDVANRLVESVYFNSTLRKTLLRDGEGSEFIIWIHDDRVNFSDVYLVSMAVKYSETFAGKIPLYSNPRWQKIT